MLKRLMDTAAYMLFPRPVRIRWLKRNSSSWLGQQYPGPLIKLDVSPLSEKIERTKRQMSELAAANGVSAETAEAKSIKLTELQRQIDEAQVELSAVSQRIRDLQPRIEATPSGVGMSGAELQQLQEQYRKGLQDLADARLKYTPSHPEVQRLEGVVAGLQERLGDDL